MDNMKKFNNFYQFIAIIVTIFMAGMWIQGQIQDLTFTEEEIRVIAKEAAREVIWEHNRDVAYEDCDDFVYGFLESHSEDVASYIEETHSNRTRVYKGGLYLLDDDLYNLRPDMEEKYGERVIRDLINGLIDFTS